MAATDRLATGITRLNAGAVRLEQATVTATNPTRINGDTEATVLTLGWADPTVGDQVWLLRSGTSVLCLGPAVPNQRPAQTGTVAAFTAGQPSVTVTVGGVNYTMPHATTYTPTVGEACLVSWWPSLSTDGATLWSGVAVSAIPTAPTPVAVPKTAKAIPDTPVIDQTAPDTSMMAVTVPAEQSGTWRGAWRTDTSRIIQGDRDGEAQSVGYWFYGDQFTKYQGSTVLAATMTVRAAADTPAPGGTVHLRTHNDAVKLDTQPAGMSSTDVTAVKLAPGQNVDLVIPANVAQALVDGTVKGMAITGAEYVELGGVGDDPATGAFTLTIERTI